VWHGTVDVIAGDKAGEICSGVSTSGLAFKLPGRAGDTPVIGAGNYADARYGAATCVGQGELAIRASAAHSAVLNLRAGKSPAQAAKAALEDVLRLDWRAVMQVLVADRRGNTAAFASQKGLHSVYWSKGMKEIERRATPVVKAKRR
jgi:beta-aspartyl-peptidase (threonine type)